MSEIRKSGNGQSEKGLQELRSPSWICKKNEIASHIRFYFEHYGEDLNYFDEYLTDVLKFDIDKALDCWRSLSKNLEFYKRERIKNEQSNQRVVPKKAAYQKKGKFCAAYRSAT